MRLGLKLSLLLAGASAVPLVGAAIVAPRDRAEVRRELGGLYSQNAVAMAESVQRELSDKLAALRLVSLDAAVLPGALRLIYQQTDGADVVALFDEQGASLAPPAYLGHPAGSGLQHEAMDEPGLLAFVKHVPLSAAWATGSALSPVYTRPDPQGQPIPRVVMAVRVNGASGASWVLAAELSLRTLADHLLASRVGDTGRAFLVDADGKAVVHPDPRVMREQADLTHHPLLSEPVDQSDVLGASAGVPLTGWRVVVAQSSSEALAPFERQRRAALYWGAAGLLGALGVSFLGVRRLTLSTLQLRQAAQWVAQGELNSQVQVSGQDELAELGEAFNQMTGGLRERERLKATFSRYVSEESDLGPAPAELTEVTVLFLEVQGFANLSERRSPGEVMELLNAYFEPVAASVTKHGGAINPFLDAAVMAVFGAPAPVDHPEERAIRAALEIQTRMGELSEVRRQAGLETAQFGAGVSTGPVIAGKLGSRERPQYVVIGEAVNLARGLEGQAGPGEVVISATTLERLGAGFQVERCGEVPLQGKQQPVELFKVTLAA